LISCTTPETLGGGTLGEPGANQFWLSTRTLPTQLPGSVAMTGRL
jgi:hypothetical protein